MKIAAWARIKRLVQARYRQLALKDRRALWVLGVFVCGMLFYGVLWYPLDDWAKQAKQHFSQRLTDWQWVMQHQRRAGQLEAHRGAATDSVHKPLMAAVLSLAKQHALVLAQVRPEGSGIEVQTDGVAFSVLIPFLTDLNRMYGIRIERLQVNKLSVGRVKSGFFLSR